MTNSDIDIKDPAPVPGIEVHEVPGLLPETETDYLAPETTHTPRFL